MNNFYNELLTEIGKRYSVIKDTVTISQKQYEYWVPKNIDDILKDITEEDFVKNDKMPYWANLWPSSIIMAHFMLHNIDLFKNRITLDIGCGIGLNSIFIAPFTKFLVSLDYDFNALRFLQLNFIENYEVFFDNQLVCLMDLRKYSLKTKFDLVIGSDVIYENQLCDIFFNVAQEALKDQGIIILTEPERYVSGPLFTKFAAKGFYHLKFNMYFSKPDSEVNQEIYIHLISREPLKKEEFIIPEREDYV